MRSKREIEEMLAILRCSSSVDGCNWDAGSIREFVSAGIIWASGGELRGSASYVAEKCVRNYKLRDVVELHQQY